MDITPLSGLLNAGLAVAVATLVVKIKQLTPKINDTLGTVDTLKEQALTVLGLIENIGLLLNSLTKVTEDGNISNEEAQQLIADAKEIIGNPAIVELREFIKTLE